MKYFIFFIFVFFLGEVSYSDDSNTYSDVFPAGFLAEYSYGKYSVKDEYISKEKYTGILPGLKLNWSRFHSNYGYFLSFEYAHSSEIKNYNVNTDIHQFIFNQGFLYPLPVISIFSKNFYFFLGPGSEFYFFNNHQDIAVSGFDYAQSAAALFSLGVNSQMILLLKKNFFLESFLHFNLLSFGFRVVDSEEDDESPVKLLTLVSANHIAFSSGVRWILTDYLSFKTAYKLCITRISAWDPLLSVSDNITFSLTYHF